VTRLASPSLVVARARPTERMALLRGEDVLDGDPDPRPAGVAAEHVRRHRFAARLRPLELRHQPAPRQQCDVRRRAVGGIGPDRARGILGVEQPAQLAPVRRGGVGDHEGADEAVPAVDAEMILVAETGMTSSLWARS
jgi:hypothetical protein